MLNIPNPPPTGIYLKIDHPYITSLRWAFQDDKYLYFIMDCMKGGDLKCWWLSDLALSLLDSNLDYFQSTGSAIKPSLRTSSGFGSQKYFVLSNISIRSRLYIGMHI
jgi:serine/threonine protein kinase